MTVLLICWKHHLESTIQEAVDVLPKDGGQNAPNATEGLQTGQGIALRRLQAIQQLLAQLAQLPLRFTRLQQIGQAPVTTANLLTD